MRGWGGFLGKKGFKERGKMWEGGERRGWRVIIIEIFYVYVWNYLIKDKRIKRKRGKEGCF